MLCAGSPTVRPTRTSGIHPTQTSRVRPTRTSGTVRPTRTSGTVRPTRTRFGPGPTPVSFLCNILQEIFVFIFITEPRLTSTKNALKVICHCHNAAAFVCVFFIRRLLSLSWCL